MQVLNVFKKGFCSWLNSHETSFDEKKQKKGLWLMGEVVFPTRKSLSCCYDTSVSESESNSML